MKLEHLFYYCAPNRRSDLTVIEIVLSWTPGDARRVREGWPAALAHIRGSASLPGWEPEPEWSPGDVDDQSTMTGLSCCLAQLALTLQQACGHKVGWRTVSVNAKRGNALVIFEHEETSVGEQAGLAALMLMEQAFPSIQFDLGGKRPKQEFDDYLKQFREHAQDLVQPDDTRAIFEAARRLDVPVVKLERDPYEPVRGDFRIRMNSMLMLGHCAHRQVIDGTFAIERSGKAAPLLGPNHQTFQVAQALGLPVAPAGETLEASHSLLLAGHELCFVKDLRTGKTQSPGIHGELVSLLEGASREMDVGLLEAQLHCSGDLSQPLSQSGVCVTRLNPAPRLDELCAGASRSMALAAERFVKWLVPAGSGSRIPIAAVTGTNGKTTTSRMIARILQTAGLRTGLQCTDGRYYNGELLEAGDSSTLMGHYRIFEDRRVEAAVLETHHRGMAEYGFAFDWCDVAVCTNVTHDHIGYSNIHSVEEMGEVKRSLPERARKYAILNADNPGCMAMIPHLNVPICLVSSRLGTEELRSLEPTPGTVCVLETVDEQQQVVLCAGLAQDQQRTVVMPVSDIPATYDGLAGFNVLNAMQAIAAATAMGISVDHIRTALSGFRMGISSTPGRINFYDGLPFRVLVDFAHNPDGALQLAEFAKRLDVPGKRIVAFSSYRSDETIYGATDSVSGRYDHYFVKEYGVPPGYKSVVFPRPKGMIIRMIHERLIENGVSDEDITVIPDEMEAVKAALDSAVQGDLVVLMLGYTGMEVIEEFMAQYVREYGKA